MPTYNTENTELNIDFTYSDSNHPVLVELKKLVNIDLSTTNDEIEKIKILCGYAHTLFPHDGMNEPSSFDPITIINEAKQGQSFRCVEYSFIAACLCWAYGIKARTLSLKTSDVETREFGAGHVVLEFWSPENSKWVMVDVEAGCMFTCNNIYLSGLELGNAIENNFDIKLVHVNGSVVPTEENIKQYIEWMRQYMYFYDTMLCQIYTTNQENNPLKDKRIMLVPNGVKNPTVFQKVLPIPNTLYTHCVKDFYKI